jgi:hypothetical protein
MRYRRRLGALVLALTVVDPAIAHTFAPEPIRELVRIQGYRAPAPSGVQVDREVVFVVLGQPVRFAASEWRAFSFSDSAGKPPAPEPAQVMLQGERALLHRISSARPDQRVTLLVERRPGSVDVFVLAVDLCPE